MVVPEVPLDAKFVAKSAAEIRKRAGRLKFNLMLPEPEKRANSRRRRPGRSPIN